MGGGELGKGHGLGSGFCKGRRMCMTASWDGRFSWGAACQEVCIWGKKEKGKEILS